jgi:hypothetical protein
VSWPKWTRKAANAGKTAMVAGQLATNVHAATDLPKPLADQYSDDVAKVRTEETRRDVRDRLDTGTRTTAAPTTSQDVRKLRKQIRPR